MKTPITYRGFTITVKPWLNGRDLRIYDGEAENEEYSIPLPHPCVGEENAIEVLKQRVDEHLSSGRADGGQ